MQLQKSHIIDSEARLMAAMKNSDWSALDTLIHDDLIFVTPDGKTATKAMDIGAYRSRNRKVHEIDPDIETVNLIGDTAVVTLTAKMQGIYQNQPFQGSFRYLPIWQLFKDQCKIIAGSVTALES